MNSIYDRFERHVDKTFREARDAYLAEYRGKDKTRAAMALDSVSPYIDHRRLIDIDDDVMRPFKHDRLQGAVHFDKPAMAGTVNKELTTALTVLNFVCRIKRWMPSAPKFVRVHGPCRKAYPLSWEEQSRLFCCLPTGWDVGAAVFAVNTGVRKEELFGLKWSDLIDVPELGPGIFVGVLNEKKNGENRAVICNSIARRVVERQREWQAKHGHDEYVFPRKMCRCSAGKTWIIAWERAGMPPDPLWRRGIHNLRHTFAYRLRAAGVSEEDRNALLGHDNQSLAQHYATPDLSRLLAAAELVTVRREMTVLRSTHSADRDPPG